jgi:hypothetical protein
VAQVGSVGIEGCAAGLPEDDSVSGCWCRTSHRGDTVEAEGATTKIDDHASDAMKERGLRSS